jgi:hypothetical protein
MDVRLVSNMPSPAPLSAEQMDNSAANATTRQGIPFIFAKEQSASVQVREQVMMNLQEVQNFLYMLIGSRLRVESNNDSVGSSVNTTV